MIRSRSLASVLALAAMACIGSAHAQSTEQDAALFQKVENRFLSASKNCAQPGAAAWNTVTQATAYAKAAKQLDACLARIATRTANLDVPKFIQTELRTESPRAKGQILLAFTTIQDNVISGLYAQRLAAQQAQASAEQYVASHT